MMMVRYIESFFASVTGGYARSFDFKGRARRRELWSLFVFHGIALVLLSSLFGQSIPAEVSVLENVGPYGLFGVSIQRDWPALIAQCLSSLHLQLYCVFLLFSLPALISVQVRRLHDVNRSGFYLLGCLMPPFLFVLLIVYLWKSDVSNRWGNPGWAMEALDEGYGDA
jgi:uncharacterized membrane protein YhaH (DUF805 family)